MMKTTLSKKYEIENLDLKQIADSGQCFRMNQLADESFFIVAGGRGAKFRQLKENKIEVIYPQEEDLPFWEKYFHLDFDYGKVVGKLSQTHDVFLKDAINFGKGLRILRQEVFETLISFIISQNKNIPAIKNSIEKIAQNFGDEKFWESENLSFFTFPEPEKLAKAALEDLRAQSLGYRDAYVKNAATAVTEGRIKPAELEKLETHALMEELMSIKGVGKKVASCVALFGFGKMDTAPVDVWIERVIKEEYGGFFDWEKHRDLAGLVQQYFFYYMRNGKKQ